MVKNEWISWIGQPLIYFYNLINLLNWFLNQRFALHHSNYVRITDLRNYYLYKGLNLTFKDVESCMSIRYSFYLKASIMFIIPPCRRRILCPTLNCIWRWYDSCGAVRSVEYLIFAITHRSTLTWIGSLALLTKWTVVTFHGTNRNLQRFCVQMEVFADMVSISVCTNSTS